WIVKIEFTVEWSVSGRINTWVAESNDKKCPPTRSTKKVYNITKEMITERLCNAFEDIENWC
ncbi:13738_t:CDS:1, partial [Gigaspora rosea]